MSNSARSVFIFGIYLVILGITLMVIPNVLLAMFFMPPTNEVWLRVAGMLVLVIGSYYILAGRKEITDFIRWTVYYRPAIIVFFIVFVLLGLASPSLILFGVFDLLGAVWTGFALRSSAIMTKVQKPIAS